MEMGREPNLVSSRKKNRGSKVKQRAHWTSWFQFGTAHNVEKPGALPVHNCYISRVKAKKKYVLVAQSEIVWSTGNYPRTRRSTERERKRITGACWREKNNKGPYRGVNCCWKYKTNVHSLYMATFLNCSHILYGGVKFGCQWIHV